MHRLFFAFALSWLIACAEDECPQLGEACDILTPDCQHQIMKAVSCMRGGRAALPKVSVISEQQLLDRYASQDTRTPAELARAERWTHGLSLFGLAPAHYEASQDRAAWADDIAAVYTGDTREILVIDRGDPLDDNDAVQLFAHELTHALQDSEHGLAKWRDKWVFNYDSSVATDAVVEGEAVFYELMTRLQLDHRSALEIDWEDYFTSWRAKELEASELDQAPLTMADVRFPYAFGGGWVMQHWLAGGHAALRALWKAPPLTTQEVLLDLPFDLEGQDRKDLLAEQAPLLGSGFESVSGSALGAWITRQFTARMAIPYTRRLEAPAALAYDLFSVQADADGVVASWRVRLRDGWNGSVWPQLYGSAISMKSNEREVYMLASDRPRADFAQLAWGELPSPPATDDMQMADVLWKHPLKRAGCFRERPRLRSKVDDHVVE
jgi:hypothetical protein